MPKAKFTLDVDPKYIKLIPANVDAQIKATTVFGNKYVSFTSPPNPEAARVTPSTPITVKSGPGGVTTEFNTLFQTVVSISEKVDPVKLNETLAATAQALDGLGDRFGQSIVHGNEILSDLNPKMPQIRYDTQKLADLADTYANASPDLFDFLHNAVTTARTLNDEQSNLDAALMASVGFGNTGGDVFERGGPYLVRGAEDLIPTSQLLNTYSPGTLLHDPQLPRRRAEGRGFAWRQRLLAADRTPRSLGAGNPYVYPDNLPRVNAHGGPEGTAGLLADDHPRSVAGAVPGDGHRRLHRAVQPLRTRPPFAIEYVWGRQIGENTINP